MQEGVTEHTIEIDLMDAKRSVRVVCGFNRTDMGNAQRLVELYGDDIRYCAELKEWFIWDGVRWAPDTTLQIRELAKNAVRLIHAEIPFIGTGNEKKIREERKELSTWAYSSEANFRLNAMIQAAQSDPRISVKASDFDANKWLINTPTGTINLESGEFRDGHDRNDLLTKVTRGRYNEEAEGGLYYEALLESLTPSEVLFFQRAWGSALEPTVKNKAMFILYGRSNSRKSTCSEPPLYALGDYACTQNITTFIKTPKRGGAARPDIVSLEGVHVAYCEETPSGMVFDDATVKSLTSLARQRARTLWEKRERDIELIVTFFIETNELPRIDTTDDDQAEAVFNRLCVITFVNPIAQADLDPSIKQRLITEQELLDAVFTWVIDGYFEYAKNGLQPPASVKEASEDYQLKMNPLAGFFRDEVIADEDAATSTRDFYVHFVQEGGIEAQRLVKSPKSFGMHFSKLAKSKGFEHEHTREGSIWNGLRIREWKDEESPNKEQNKAGDNVTSFSPFLIMSPCNILTYRELMQKWGFSCHVITNPSSVPVLEAEDGDSSDCKTSIEAHIKDERAEQAEVVEKIRDYLLTTKAQLKGEAIESDFLEDALTNRIKIQLGRDYDVLSLYRKLVESDKEIQAIITELTT